MNEAVSPRAISTSSSRRRGDIQGVRAIGIVLIVIFHIWIGKVSGGVDVLFVISGFLMTGVLMRDLETTGHIHFFKFWGRICLRILPSAFAILLVTFAVGSQIIPASQWLGFANHALASLLQIENIHLMMTSTDYLARAEPPTPFQHFWALSIQMQFFMLLPVLVFGLVLACRLPKLEKQGRTAFMAATFAVLAAISFAYASWQVTVDPHPTYFGFPARLWEFLLGGICALTIHRMAIPDTARIAMGWAGLAVLLACGFIIPVSWPYPGPVALVPVAAALFLLIAGHGKQEVGASVFLSHPLLQAIGNISFTIYLWHWPVLIFAMEIFGTTHLGLGQGLAVIALSVALAYATYRYVEQPMRQLGSGEFLAGRPSWMKTALPFAISMAMAVPVGAAMLIWKEGYEREASGYLADMPPPSPAGKLQGVQEVAGPGIARHRPATGRHSPYAARRPFLQPEHRRGGGHRLRLRPRAAGCAGGRAGGRFAFPALVSSIRNHGPGGTAACLEHHQGSMPTRRRSRQRVLPKMADGGGRGTGAPEARRRVHHGDTAGGRRKGRCRSGKLQGGLGRVAGAGAACRRHSRQSVDARPHGRLRGTQSRQSQGLRRRAGKGVERCEPRSRFQWTGRRFSDRSFRLFLHGGFLPRRRGWDRPVLGQQPPDKTVCKKSFISAGGGACKNSSEI